jgi:hypothetical protein
MTYVFRWVILDIVSSLAPPRSCGRSGMHTQSHHGDATMRPYIQIVMIVLALTFWLFADTANGLGKGGGGGGRGGGGGGRGGGGRRVATSGHSHGGKPTAHHGHGGSSQRQANTGGFRDSQRPKQVDHKPSRHTDRIARDGGTREVNHPWSMQRANEERKLNHRLGVADKLDRLADANGNENLRSTAERMRQKAQEHYDKRLAKIDSKLPPIDEGGELPDELPETDPALPELPVDAAGSELANPSPAPPVAGQKLTGRENALSRQLFNAERKLTRQTEVAERLRAIAEEQGDAALLETADRLEQQALEHFEKRMDAIGSFQERHGLVLDQPLVQ